MSTGNVLNPTLFARLVRRFKVVKVRNPGQRRVVRPDPFGGAKLRVVQWGEQYAVRCPFCVDFGFRLSLSYMYAQLEGGRPATYLVYCQTGCLSLSENRVRLSNMLGVGGGVLEEAPVGPGALADADRAVALPEGLERLDDLARKHPARRFLVRRGLDPDRAGKFYGVSYCPESEDSLARRRLIIPYRSGGEVRGWQSLAVHGDDPEEQPRYLSARGMQSGRLVYNLDRAKQYATVVIVADPMTVWAFGPMAVCIPTTSLADRQRRLILVTSRNRTAALLLPAGASREPYGRGLLQSLRESMPGQFVAVEMPAVSGGKLPEREVLRDLVRQEANAKGVRVLFRKEETQG